MDEGLRPILLVFCGLFGLLVGSFLNVCIFRLPRNCMSLVKPRSRCPKCLNWIAWYDNIPVASWLVLGGKCRGCRAPISPRYALVELLTGALFLYAGQRQLSGAATPGFDQGVVFALHAWFLGALIVCTFIDLDLQILPDEITISGVGIGLAASAFFPFLQHGATPAFGEPWLSALTGSAAGALLGGGTAWVVRRRRKVLVQQEARLLGNVKIMALVCAILGLGVSALYPFFWPGAKVVLREPWLAALVGSAFGALLGGGVIWVVGELGAFVFKKDAMGFGDVKYMAMVGAVLGWKGVLWTFMLACLLGSLFGIGKFVAVRRMGYVPFGPFLSGGALVMLLWPHWVDVGVRWYLGFFRSGPP